MTILEVQPGGGWWTEILAPYAKANKGEFYATAADIDDPGLSEGARKGRADFDAKYADAAIYGKVNLVNWGAKAAPLPANKFDFVLAARVFHGWAGRVARRQSREHLQQPQAGRRARASSSIAATRARSRRSTRAT